MTSLFALAALSISAPAPENIPVPYPPDGWALVECRCLRTGLGRSEHHLESEFEVVRVVVGEGRLVKEAFTVQYQYPDAKFTHGIVCGSDLCVVPFETDDHAYWWVRRTKTCVEAVSDCSELVEKVTHRPESLITRLDRRRTGRLGAAEVPSAEAVECWVKAIAEVARTRRSRDRDNLLKEYTDSEHECISEWAKWLRHKLDRERPR